MTTAERDALRDRLAQHPADRYPAQHATTQFHLGALLLHAGETGPALEALWAARDVFGRIGMQAEHAKAGLMLGVGLRGAGRNTQAEAAFEAALPELAALGLVAEQAAAAYNLGLVRADLGRPAQARDAWEQARELFVAEGHLAQAAAAARDHGASLLADGNAPQAVPLLEQAVRLAEASGDLPGVGAAANVLGLARLACGQPGPAAEALRAAVGAFPRSVRPAEHAMAKANLALAYAACDQPARARLAAMQALALPRAQAPVRAQAVALLERLPGDPVQDLQTVLTETPPEQWTAVLREEVLRSGELPTRDRRAVLRGILDGLLGHPEQADDLAESLLHVVVELPPRPYTQVVEALVHGSSGRPAEQTARLHSVVGSAMARFAIPQWQRLAAALNEAAAAAGQPQAWR